MTGDWLDTVSVLAAEGCAVFGKFGVRQTGVIHPGLCSPGLATTAAGAISAPVLFHVQWDVRLGLLPS